MLNSEVIAGELYTTYSASVGGVNFKGEPLPEWDEFRKDPTKTKQSDAWVAVADRAIQLLTNP